MQSVAALSRRCPDSSRAFGFILLKFMCRQVPVLQLQARYPAKLCGIGGNEYKTGSPGMTGQEHVVRADHTALGFQKAQMRPASLAASPSKTSSLTVARGCRGFDDGGDFADSYRRRKREKICTCGRVWHIGKGCQLSQVRYQ